MAYDWPGNVRELENTIERAVVLGTTEWIIPEDLPEVLLESKVTVAGAMTTYHEAVVQNKKQIILRALEQAQNDQAEAARLLGIHPNYLERLIVNLNLRDR
jgi:DNA-binding NtrC family response regulator